MGCTTSSAALSFCNPGITKAEYPTIDSRMKTEAYSQVYRYNENVHSFGGPSGEAEKRGNDYITALAGFGTAWNGHPGGTRHEQSGTHAHELLHLFGEFHGGPEWFIHNPLKTPLADALVNCKVYPGVDKYSGQLPNTYLTASLVDPSNPQSDVLPTSDWQLTYSDGSHGINPFEQFPLFDPTGVGALHVTDMINNRGGALGGLDEGFLVEDLTAGLPGTPYTMTWATPGGHSTGSHDTHTQFSDATGPLPENSDSNTVLSLTDIDWDDSEGIDAGTVSADINNYGFPGCRTEIGDPDDPIHFDYDTFYHMDFKFQDASGGSFDGVTNFLVEQTEGDANLAVLNRANYDGIEEIGLTQFREDGTGTIIAGVILPIEISLLDPNSNVEITGSQTVAQVYLSRNIDAESGTDVETDWVLVSDVDISAPTTMQFDTSTTSLVMPWLTPARGSDIPGKTDSYEVEGIWYGRIVLSDPALVEAQITQCHTTSNFVPFPDGEGPLDTQVKTCLVGDVLTPDSAFLIDNECTDGACLSDAGATPQDSERGKVTFKVTLEQPKTIKETTYTDLLDDLKSPPPAISKESKKDLNKAISHITASIDPILWVDELILQSTNITNANLFGKAVFQEEKAAATNLMDILGLPTTGKATSPVNADTPVFLAQVREVLLLIEIVDRILAENHIEDATTLSGAAAECVVLANAEMNLAQAATLLEKYDVAINHYQQAWNLANKELLGQNCGGSVPPPVPEDDDGDGISNADENSGALNILFGNESTDPNNPDSDGDGLSDGFEIQNGTNPNDSNDPPPPPPPTEQVEVDELITLIASLTKDKEINKGLSNSLTGQAQDAKIDFINGNDIAGCTKINDIEDDIVQATSNKMSDTAEIALLADSPAVGSTKSIHAVKGCVDNLPDGG